MCPKHYVTYQIKFEPHLAVNSQNIPKETRKNILSIKLSEKKKRLEVCPSLFIISS